MKKTKQGLTIAILALFVISLTISARAATNPIFTLSDNTIQKCHPGTVYSTQTDLLVRGSGCKSDALMKFDLSDKPLNLPFAFLYFRVMEFTAPARLSFYEIPATWSTSYTSWSNAPSVGTHITNVSITRTGIYQINVSLFVFFHLGEWSVRINTSQYNDVEVRLSCEESVDGGLKPQIRFSSGVGGGIGVDLSPFIIISTVIGLVTVVVLNKKRLSKK
jgi:hypothetical protein